MFDLGMAFQLEYLLLAAAGAGAGIIWGAMPGLSTTMAMALLVGLTYGMSLEAAVVFMLGVFTGSTFGGAISAILINIPGTPAAVPTQLAGFPLAKRGQGGLALGTAITFSMFGNWAGILALLLLAPLILQAAMQFGSWEVCLLGIWGVSIAGALGSEGQPVLKGWMSGWLGLLIATIGREAIHGHERFTFGSIELVGGILYLPLLIGLFGMAEVFMVLSERTPYSIPQKIGRMFPSLSIIRKYWTAGIRSSFLGVLIGVVPGAGANIASFAAYGAGEKISKKDFSKGDLEGVVCSEVANNACLGGSLLPTLTLGIPGSAPAAAFLAALNLQGIIVGPMIAHHHPGLVQFMYGTLIVANIAMFLLAFLIIKPSVRFFALPRELLMPLVTLLCVIGAFAGKLAMFDVHLMFILGVFGFILRKARFPLAPLVLGVILGPLVDVNLRRAMIIFQNASIWDILAQPVGTTLLVIIIITFLAGLIKGKTRVG